jgi:hypothetical protein
MPKSTEAKDKQKEEAPPIFGTQIRFAINTIMKAIQELKDPDQTKKDKESDRKDTNT